MKSKYGLRKTTAGLVLSSLVVLLAACGGGGGGGGGGGSAPAPAPLAAGNFNKTVDKGGSTWTSLFANNAYARFQYLYLPADIKGAGKLSSIAVKYLTAQAAVSCPDVTIRLSHSNLTALSGTFANNLSTGKGGQTTVLKNAVVNFPAGAAGTWQTPAIAFTTPFNYNGIDGLIAEFELVGACSGAVSDSTNAAWAYNAALWSFTSGATTGTNGTWAIDAKFNFAGGDNKVDFLSAGMTGNAAPLSTTVNFQKVQMLYNASSIAGSGAVTGIGLQVGAATTAAQTYTYTMKLGHSSLTNLGTTWTSNFNVGSPVTVAQSVTFTVPAGIPAGGFIWLPIPGGIFTYDGTNNLVIELTVESATGGVTLYTHPTANTNRIYDDPASPTAAFTNTYAHQIALRFHGAPVSVVTDGAVSDTRFFPAGIATGIASLFRASELGTGGTITSISCRAAINTAAGSYPSFKLVIGHTTADTLTSTADFVSQNVAYSAAYSIPNTLQRGDWIDIPLSTPFAYDGVRNLIIWQGSTAADGTGTNRCSFSTADATRYPAHTGLGVPGVSYTGSSNLKTDISLAISK